MNKGINELNEVVKYFSSRPPDDDVLKWIFKFAYIRLAIMIAFGLMDAGNRFQRYFQNSGNFGGITSNRPLAIPKPDERLDVSGPREGLEVSDGPDEINLILADFQLFFQLPEGGRNRIGICTFHVASRQGHLVAPGVTFGI